MNIKWLSTTKEINESSPLIIKISVINPIKVRVNTLWVITKNIFGVYNNGNQREYD